jgi:hypothetical protein
MTPEANGFVHQAPSGTSKHLERRCHALQASFGEPDPYLAAVHAVFVATASHPAEFFERREHPADHRGADAQATPKLALRFAEASRLGAVTQQRIKHVEARRGEPERPKWLSHHAQNAVKGSLGSEEDLIHGVPPCAPPAARVVPRAPAHSPAPSVRWRYLVVPSHDCSTTPRSLPWQRSCRFAGGVAEDEEAPAGGWRRRFKGVPGQAPSRGGRAVQTSL